MKKPIQPEENPQVIPEGDEKAEEGKDNSEVATTKDDQINHLKGEKNEIVEDRVIPENMEEEYADEEIEEERTFGRGSIPETTFARMNIERYVGELRGELDETRSENQRLIEQVAMHVREIRELEKSLALYKGLMNTQNAASSNVFEDARRMVNMVGKISAESVGQDLALRQLGGEVNIKDGVIERLQDRVGEKLSMDKLEDIAEFVLEMVGWTKQISSKNGNVQTADTSQSAGTRKK